MTVTINLPQIVEQAYLAAARTQGVEEHGIPVLRTGQPLDPTVVADTLDAIRRERDLSVLGQC